MRLNHLQTEILKFWGAFFPVENQEFYLEPKKCFRVPTPWGLYGAEWDERYCGFCTFQPFLLCWQFWIPR